VSVTGANSFSVNPASTFTGAITANGGLLGSVTLSTGKSITAQTGAVINGIVSAAPTASWSVTVVASDRTLKMSIKPLKNSLQRLMKVKGTSFYWTKDKMNFLQKGRDFDKFKRRKLGFMAQNVKDIIPEAVSYNADKLTKKKHFAIDYKSFIPLLIEAVKEIYNNNIKKDGIINNLSNKISDLEERIRIKISEDDKIKILEERILKLEKLLFKQE
jgi:hypothetical protein